MKAVFNEEVAVARGEGKGEKQWDEEENAQRECQQREYMEHEARESPFNTLKH